jgi:hypothetical protein
MSNGSSLSLSSASGWFGFYFSDGLTDYYLYQYDSAGPVNQWLLKKWQTLQPGGRLLFPM